MGRRFGEYTHDNTKCMLEVNGIKLIDRALATLHEINVSRVFLVVDYKGQNVRNYVGEYSLFTPIVYVDNPIYNKTNSFDSFLLINPDNPFGNHIPFNELLDLIE